MNLSGILSKTAFKQQKSARLSGFYFFYYAVLGLFLPFWSLYLETIGFDKAQIGLLIGLTMLARIVAPMVWGYLADMSGRRMVWIQIALVSELACWLLMFVVPRSVGWYALVLGGFSFFLNASIAQFEAVTLYWIDRQDNYGQVRLWGSVGFIIAVLGLGVFLSWFSLLALPLILGGAVLASCLIAFTIAEPPQQSGQCKDNVSSSFTQHLRQPLILKFYLAHFVVMLAQAPFYGFYSNYLSGFGYSGSVVSLLWSTGVIAEVLLFIKAKPILRRLAFKQAGLIVFVVSAIRWYLVSQFPNSLSIQILAQLGHAATFALFHTIAMQFIFYHFDDSQQGRAQSLYSTLWGLGVGVGIMLVGAYWNQVGGQGWFLMSSVLFMLLAVLWWWHYPKDRYPIAQSLSRQC